MAASVPPKLLAVLQEAIAKGGPEGAIDVCRPKAPQMAKEASEATGWSIRRVSLRNRKPNAVPDARERAALEEFDRSAASGGNPATLEIGEVAVDNGVKSYRYIEALPTQNCASPVTARPTRSAPRSRRSSGSTIRTTGPPATRPGRSAAR